MSFRTKFGAKSLLFATALSVLRQTGVHADIPTAEITISYTPTSPSDRTTLNNEDNGRVELSLLATQASFGSYPPQHKKGVTMKDYPYSYTPVFAPDADSLLCNSAEDMANMNANDIPNYRDSPVVMLVPRGRCTFEQKALNAQIRYNAKAVIVYGALSSRYGYNETTQKVIYPLDKYDYDCSYGEGTVNYNQLTFDPIYEPSNDALVNGQCETGDGRKTCASHKCLLTSPPDASGSSQICCAWDLPIWLYQDPTIPANTTDTIVLIPAMYITMDQFDEVYGIMTTDKNVILSMYARDRPAYNLSGIFVWVLGVFTAFLASYLSASEIRKHTKQITNGALIPQEDNYENPEPRERHVRSGELRSRSKSPMSKKTLPVQNNLTPVTIEEAPGIQYSRSQDEGDEDSVEITFKHALFFIVWSSFSLLLLFYLKIYNLVKIMYAFGCAGALTQVMIMPLFDYLTRGRPNAHRIFISTSKLEIGDMTYVECASLFTGYMIGFVWLILAFALHHPEGNTFFWVVQDLMGISICVMFLSILKVNQLKIASALLIAAFFYDIFFVFITPYIFSGQSVMVTVATSGGPPTADPLWCEKYPSDKGCQGGEPLPMLLTIPRIADYQGGASLLGLGDIVLPGLVLSFASRLDASKKLVGAMRGGRSSLESSGFFKSYFGLIVIAYAIGLMMANIAVVVMQMGQPALLYLVPMCLGSLFFVGWNNGEILELWNGPRVLKAAEHYIRDAERRVHGHPSGDHEDNISLTGVEADAENISGPGTFT